MKILIYTLIYILIYTSFLFAQEDENLIELKKLLEGIYKKTETIICDAEHTSYQYERPVGKMKLKIYAKSPNKFKVEYLSPEKVKGSLLLTNGKILWKYVPKFDKAFKIVLQKTEDKPGMFTQELSYIAQLVTPHPEEYFKKNTWEVLRIDNFENKEVYVVKVTPKIKSKIIPVQTLWIDKKTGICLKAEVDIELLDRKEVITFYNHQFNVKLDDEIFEYKGKIF